jgi:hypothetical protein
MPRNGSGTFTLVSGNPVVTGTTIESTWANNTLSDIASAMTDSLSRSGQGSMSAAFRAADGTSSVPGISWSSETTSGLYRAGAADTRLVITTNEVQKWLTTGTAITGTFSATGNAGFGTTSPTFGSGSGLEIERAGIATLRLENSSASNSFELYVDTAGNGVNFRGRDSSPLNFWTGNTQRAAIDVNGNVGVNTASPTNFGANYRTLHVAGADTTNGGVFRSSNSTASVVGDMFVDGTTFNVRAGTSTNLALGANNTAAAYIDTAGNFGVGTSSMSEKLHVEGKIVARPASTQDAVIISGRAGGTSSYASTITPATLTASRTVTIPDETFTIGYRNIPAVGTKTGSYTLATTDVGKYVQVGTGGSITIPNSTFAEGDVVMIFNNTSGNITITCTITTAYIGGTDADKATVTVATRGVANIMFISGTVCVITGNVS